MTMTEPSRERSNLHIIIEADESSVPPEGGGDKNTEDASYEKKDGQRNSGEEIHDVINTRTGLTKADVQMLSKIPCLFSMDTDRKH